MINRRGLITGLISFVAAPAIVRASSLMPVRAIRPNVGIECASIYGTLKVGDWITFPVWPVQGNQQFVVTYTGEQSLEIYST